jgi:hypothetical protein
VTIQFSGLFDFESDEQSETWFTVYHPNRPGLEFWILAQTPAGIRALFVSEVNSTRPVLTRLTPINGASVIQLGSQTVFLFERLPSTGEPYVTPLEPEELDRNTSYASQSLDQAQDSLFAGGDPALVREVLLKIQKGSGFSCASGKFDCPRFYYLLGLADELLGDERLAVDAYLKLWRAYPDSPYTIMARLKLKWE